MERDVYDKENLIFDGNFNSHAHVERDRSGIALFSWSTNFNSHAHVERDTGARKLCLMILISTHTLTWSVT